MVFFERLHHPPWHNLSAILKPERSPHFHGFTTAWEGLNYTQAVTQAVWRKIELYKIGSTDLFFKRPSDTSRSRNHIGAIIWGSWIVRHWPGHAAARRGSTWWFDFIGTRRSRKFSSKNGSVGPLINGFDVGLRQSSAPDAARHLWWCLGCSLEPSYFRYHSSKEKPIWYTCNRYSWTFFIWKQNRVKHIASYRSSYSI